MKSFSIQRRRHIVTRFLLRFPINVTDIIWGKLKDFLKSVKYGVALCGTQSKLPRMNYQQISGCVRIRQR